MNRETKGILQQMLELDPQDEIPREVSDLYEKTSAIHRQVRPRTEISCEGLALIVALAGSRPETQREELCRIAADIGTKTRSGEDKKKMLQRMENMRAKRGQKKGANDGRVESIAKP